MTAVPWLIRRIATRTFGQGPRTFAPLAHFGAAARSLRHEPGETFTTIAPRVVDDQTPEDTSTWPIERIEAPSRSAYVLAHAGLYDDDGVIYERATRRAIKETLDYWNRPPSHHPALGLPRLNRPRDLEGLSIFVGGLGGQTFFHFFIETLPQLKVLGPELAAARRLIVQGYIEAEKEAWLRRAGISLPIVWLKPLEHLLCEQLAFCPRIVRHYQPNPWALAALRELVGARSYISNNRSRFIWADRRRSPMRPILWEDDLIRQLPAPWEAVDFSMLSPDQTLALCAECAALAGFHGAAFSNLALCPPGVRVFEFYQEPKESWYPALSALAGHPHRVAMAAIGKVAIVQRLRDDALRIESAPS